MPDNEWRKFSVVPRSHPLRPLVLYFFVFRGGNRRTFRLPGEGGDHFHCTVEPSPGHIQCRSRTDVCRVKNTMNLAFAAAKCLVKNGVKSVVKNSGRFRASFLRKEERHFPWRLPHAVSEANLTAALLRALQRRGLRPKAREYWKNMLREPGSYVLVIS